MTKLPTYEMVIDENPESEVEVSFVALVDKPAIEKNFMAFNNVRLEFKIEPDRQIISGPAMVPDTLIYRRDQGGEYNVFFSKPTIEKIALKFFKQDYQKNLNLFHDPTLSLQGVTIFESFISDKARGVQPMKGFEDLPDGTWFISAKVENPNVWAKIQSGEVKGFSVEGIFSYMKKPKDVESQLMEVLNATLSTDGHLSETDRMNIVQKMMAAFKEKFDGTPLVAPAPVPAPAPTPQTLTQDYKSKDGQVMAIDRLEVGGVALVNGVPAPSGEFELEDGTRITIGEGGIITLVTPSMTAAPALTMSEVDAAIKKAFTEYETRMLAQSQQLKAAEEALGKQKTTLEAQDKKIQGLFEIMEEMAKVPTADPVGDNHLTFSQQKVKSKEEHKAILIEMLRKKKEAK